MKTGAMRYPGLWCSRGKSRLSKESSYIDEKTKLSDSGISFSLRLSPVFPFLAGARIFSIVCDFRRAFSAKTNLVEAVKELHQERRLPPAW